MSILATLLFIFLGHQAQAKFYMGAIPQLGITHFTQVGTHPGSPPTKEEQLSGGFRGMGGFTLWTPQLEMRGDLSYLTSLDAKDEKYKLSFFDAYGETRILFWPPSFLTLGITAGMGYNSMDSTPQQLGYKHAWGGSNKVIAIFNINTFLLGNFVGEVGQTFFHGVRGYRETKLNMLWDATIIERGQYDYYPYRFQNHLFTLFFNYTNRVIPLPYAGVNYRYQRKDYVTGLVFSF